ncbi:MAG: alkaline phosphatase family protein, partial [Acidobacteria bacterium]|nr:alkaline phosphatase family protein [Acidobacteriota bacterium]
MCNNLTDTGAATLAPGAHDGQVAAAAGGAIQTAVAPHAEAARIVAVAGRTRRRRLLLCLDGVPLEVIRAAKSRGLFDNFGEPSGLLSPFPTLTNVALSAMLGATAPLGYESLYFDKDCGELRGGIKKYIGRRTPDKVPSSYMDELDYQEPLPFEFLVYVAPDAVWQADMRRFRERFRSAPQGRDFFAFLKGTDGLLHIRGPRKLQVALESLDKILRELQAWCGDETEIVLFSDHGMNLEENRRINLQTQLRAAGFTVTDRFRGGERGARRALSAPAFGLCGYAALYCSDETDPVEVSAALSTLEGVDFSLYREGASAVTLRGARGAARITRAENGRGPRYSYETLSGDPLALAPVRRALAEAGELDAAGFASDAAWLARTGAHEYPDALANLFNSLHSPRVRHTADVLVSCRDGYYYGMSFFSRFVRLLATHGNALSASTNAFLMSTHRDFPAHVRADDAQP